jgi:nucleoid DNA-binding protein
MDEIVAVVVKKTGLTEEQAHSAVEAFFDYLKKKLPEGIGSHLDDLAGSNQEGGVLG